MNDKNYNLMSLRTAQKSHRRVCFRRKMMAVIVRGINYWKEEFLVWQTYEHIPKFTPRQNREKKGLKENRQNILRLFFLFFFFIKQLKFMRQKNFAQKSTHDRCRVSEWECESERENFPIIFIFPCLNPPYFFRIFRVLSYGKQ